VNDLFEQPDDATPLTPEEMRDLIPAHIAYRRELNEAEQENIARAQDWALNRRRDPLSENGRVLGNSLLYPLLPIFWMACEQKFFRLDKCQRHGGLQLLGFPVLAVFNFD
jgi:hypothetical protein